MATRSDCGTNKGYNRHTYLKEATCAPCRKAHAEYCVMKRVDLARAKARQRLLQQATRDALEALAHRHPEEFRALRARALQDLSSS